MALRQMPQNRKEGKKSLSYFLSVVGLLRQSASTCLMYSLSKLKLVFSISRTTSGVSSVFLLNLAIVLTAEAMPEFVQPGGQIPFPKIQGNSVSRGKGFSPGLPKILLSMA